ncbi:ABC transporter permease [Anabaena sp. PCC 7938]|uniref:ABC-type transporter, integral membrane subunit n=1 Tax=Anabaena cylindrica (strain ATCC 27899 / PCC 7122) TaxID=272123 RepID=K9ZMY8_ANACC|nr:MULTISPECIES: ABC transporter permease [Anabaena]AFZ59912.1 ABC-type transporter, integral membrane subunit [Anabaena cylindrica PCC 7122]BAY03033.1 binding-protein-dependent transporter inner membrane protein [Anabaena cylindrica PCC 7122]
MNISNSNDKKPIEWLAVFSLLIFVFMYLPILVLSFYSFNKSPYSANWQGFTLEWYQKLFHDDRILSALNNSLFVAFSAVTVAAILGTLMAVGLARYEFPGKKLYRGISYLPLLIPDIAIAVATLVCLAAFAIPLSIWTIVAAHIVFCLSYIALVVSARLSNLDPHLEEAALDLGATPIQAFIKVVLPQLMPGIVSGCLLAFVLSLDDFLISSFTAGSGSNTLPMEIFSRIRTGVKPDINALSVILISVTATVAVIAELIRISGDKQK